MMVNATAPSRHANPAAMVTGSIVSGFAYPYILGAIKDGTGSFVNGFIALTIATVVLCAISPLFIKDTKTAPAEEAGAVGVRH